jgi:hypothetical protein
LAALFVWYLHIGFKPNSAAQHPEKLHQDRAFMAFVIVLVLMSMALLFIDVPWLHGLLDSTLVPLPG